MDDHYFGTLKPRVSEYMKDLDMELWKIGIPAKTEHNEVAPCQHELAAVVEAIEKGEFFERAKRCKFRKINLEEIF